VSDGFFRTLGVQPILGRNFAAGEDLPSAPRHVLLSYAAWQNRYGGSSNVLGQSVTLDGKSEHHHRCPAFIFPFRAHRTDRILVNTSSLYG